METPDGSKRSRVLSVLLDDDMAARFENGQENQENFYDGEEEEEQEAEPDWQMIASNPRAKDDVPVFLSAQQKRRDAENRFACAMDSAFEELRFCSESLLRIAAGVSNSKSEQLDHMEANIREVFIQNHQSMSDMNTKLQAFAIQAQKQVEELKARLANY